MAHASHRGSRRAGATMQTKIQKKKAAHSRRHPAPRSWLSRLIWPSLALTFLVVIIVLVHANSTNVPLAQTSDQQQLAPTFTLPTLAGTTFDLAQKRGHPVVLYFMAPCASSLQGSQDVARALQSANMAGAEALVIDANSGDHPADLSTFVKQTGIAATAPINFGIDTTGVLLSAYQVQTLETSVVIDPQGHVAYQGVGSLSSEHLVQIVREMT